MNDMPLSDGGGGVGRHVMSLSAFLQEAGWSVTIATRHAGGKRAGVRAHRGTRVVALGPRTVVPSVRAASLVHLHGGRTLPVAITAFLAWILRTPFVYTPHAYYDTPLPSRPSPRDRFQHGLRWAKKLAWDQAVERFLLGCGGRTILLAPFWVDYVRAKHLPTGHLSVIPNAVDVANIDVLPRAPGTLEGSPALLTVGRLDEVKQVDDIVRALREPGMVSAVLHIVGTGSDRERIEGVVRSMDVEHQVRWHGFVDDAEVARMMAGADAFVIASRQEGLPTTVLESIVRGTPVVASDIPPHRHLLDIIGERSLFPVGDAAALARMAQLVWGRDVPEEARERIRRAFSWQTNGPRILEVYASVARRAS